MWSKTLFLGLRVRVRAQGRRFRLFLPLAVYPLSGLLLACDPVLSLLPGGLGERARAAADTAHAALYAVMESEPQTFVHVSTESREEQVLVDLSTWGFRGGDEEQA